MLSKSKKGIKRRSFIKKSSAGLLGAGMLNAKKSFGNEEDTAEDKSPRIKEYRTLGRTGFKASDIGLGGAKITDAEVVKALIRTGVNYLDTSESYRNGNSEVMIGNAIKEFDRKSLFITTKMADVFKPFESKEQVLKLARGSLTRLNTEYIDCYMLHAAQDTEIVKDKYFHEAMKQLKNEGRVRFCGISCHGRNPSIESVKDGHYSGKMDEILLTAAEDGRFDVLLMTYNYQMQDMGNRVMNACKEKNIGMTIMKTAIYNYYISIKTQIEKDIKEGAEVTEQRKRSLLAWGQNLEQAELFNKKYNLTGEDEIKNATIRFALDNPDADSVLVSFSSFEDIDKYLALSGKPLSTSEHKMLKDYEQAFGRFYCRHACGECEQYCPHHVPVNTIMRYNQYFHNNNQHEYATEKYASLPGHNADMCKNCEGHCEKACPYDVPIQSMLNIAHKDLTAFA
ncbi:aldo/keto reductase [Candidatus Latescibacterota bacterium]